LWCLSEGVEPGDRASDDQGLNGVGALVGVNGFDVGVVPSDVVIEQDPVAAQDIPSIAQTRRAPSPVFSLASAACSIDTRPRACNCDIRVHINCMPVMSLSMCASLSWIS
jgi:hypothetical protein